MKNFGNILVFILICSGCYHTPTPSFQEDYQKVRFTVIGDFGDSHDANRSVGELVNSWEPEFIITTGDNNYGFGNTHSYKGNIGNQYCDYIYNPNAPLAVRCDGKAAREEVNRFFPAYGNHDLWGLNDSINYFDYFDLPGNEEYYDFRWGPIHFFFLNSNDTKLNPCCDHEQGKWLKEGLSESESLYKLIIFHHPPYSPGRHGNNPKMNWPYREWGATAVISGHDHIYSTIVEKVYPDFYYIVNGLGGNRNKYVCDGHPLDPEKFEVTCYNEAHGAMLVDADINEMVLSFISIDNPEAPISKVKIKPNH